MVTPNTLPIEPATTTPAALAAPPLAAAAPPVGPAAAPTTLPAAPPPPEIPSADVVAAEATRTAEALAAARAEVEYYRREAAAGELRSQAVTYQRQLEGDGWPPELAAIQARTWFEREDVKRQLGVVSETVEQSAKAQVARNFAAQFGIDASVLMGYATPEAMQVAAQRMGSDNRRIATLEAKLAALAGDTVPAQTFSNGQGAPSTPDSIFITLYSEGKSNDHVRAKKLLGL